MHFVHPLFLLALSALAIPILIHLFNFRKFKKVYFTNVRFLAEIQSETKKQSTLKQWLLLLTRLLAIASLVLAFAQPFIPFSQQQKKPGARHAVSVYIDNSWSMEALATNGHLIEIAKSKALEISSAYSPSDLFQLLTNDFEGRHQRFVSLDEFRSLVEDVHLSPSSRKLSAVISRQNELLSYNRKIALDAYIISDFQKSMADFQQVHPDTSVSWYLVPLVAEKRNNLFIDTLFFDSPAHQPGQPVRLTIRIRNASTESLEKIPVKLHINNVQKAIASFNVESGSSVEVVLPYTENSSGFQFGVVEISDYPVVYDDKFYFAYSVLPTIPVLCINGNGENRYLNALFQSDSGFSFRNIPDKKLDYSSFSQYSLIFLNDVEEIPSGLVQELSRYMRNGGNVAIFPSEKANRLSYNAFLTSLNGPSLDNADTSEQRIAELTLSSLLFQDVFEKNASGKVVLPDNVDLPVVYRHYVISQPSRNAMEVLMKLQNDHPFLVELPVEKGRLYLFTSPVNESWTSFPKHVLFVPVLFKLALLSEPVQKLYSTLGKEESIALSSDSLPEKNPYKIKKIDSPFEFIPEARTIQSKVLLLTHNNLTEAGIYNVLSGKKNVLGLGFNYDRMESDMQCLSSTEITDQLNRLRMKNAYIIQDRKVSISIQIQQLNQGYPLWKWFVLLALIFLAAEIAIIRLIRQ